MTETQSRKPSLLINAISNYVALGIHIVIGLLLTPFIIKHLGKNGYGIWTFIITFVGYYGLINLGVGSAITRYIARYRGQDNAEAMNKTASTALAMFCCTGLIVIAISLLIADPLTKFFKVPSEHLEDFRYMVWIIGLATAISFPGEVFGAILIANEKFVPSNFVKIGIALTRTALVVCLLLLGKGLIGVAFSTLGGQLFGFLAYYLCFKFFTPHVRVNFMYAQWDFLRKLLAYGGITTVITIADHLRMQLDSFVIGKWVGMAEVGIYGLAALLIRYIMSLILSAMNVLTPRFSSLHGSNDLEKIKHLFLNSLHISSFLACGCCMGAFIFGGHFINLWVGENFNNSKYILWILSVSFAFALSQTPGIGLMYALKKHHFYAIATIIEAIANLTLSILLVSKYGIIGVALGTAIPMIIVKIFIQPIYVSRIIDINILAYIKSIIPYILLSFIIVVAAYYFGIITYDPVTIPFLIFSVAIICLFYILGSYLLMNKSVKSYLIHQIVKVKSKKAKL